MGVSRQTLTDLCEQVGLDGVGVAAVKTPLHYGAYLRWLQQGLHADMDYMRSRAEQRGDPTKLLAGAKSLICFSWNYYKHLPTQPTDESVRIARYAQGEDYHHKLRTSFANFGNYSAIAKI